MTSLVTEHFGAPSSMRENRLADFARRRAVDRLAGRTVWCASALAEGRSRARRLRASLRWADDDGVMTRELEVTGADELREVAQVLEAMLDGAGASRPPGPVEREVYASGSGEALLGSEVRPGDVVVLHDAMTAALVAAVRERGAHAVWHDQPRRVHRTGPSGVAMRFLQVYLAATDAYLVTWRQAAARGLLAQEIAALMPSPDVLAAKEIGEGAAGDLAWGSLIADVVEDDRGERVGGTRHVRPVVSVR